MAIEYLGLSSINGPLGVLEGLQMHSMMRLWNLQQKKAAEDGRIIELNEDKAVIQVFEGRRICRFKIPIPS